MCVCSSMCVRERAQSPGMPEEDIRSPGATVIHSYKAVPHRSWELDSRPQQEQATNVLHHWAISPTQKLTFLSELTHRGQVTNPSVNGGKTQWPPSWKIQTVSFCLPNNKHWLQCWKGHLSSAQWLTYWQIASCHSPGFQEVRDMLFIENN